MIDLVQRGVRDETGGRQRPWVQYDGLPRDFVFVPEQTADLGQSELHQKSPHLALAPAWKHHLRRLDDDLDVAG